MKISEVCGVAVKWLLTGEGDKNGPPIPDPVGEANEALSFGDPPRQVAGPPYINRGRVHDPAEFLGETSSWDNIAPVGLGHANAIPVLGLVPAGDPQPADDGDHAPGSADEYIYSDIRGRNLFAVKVTNDSMTPVFREGDYLIVNPNLQANSGDYVLAKVNDDTEATFKRLVLHLIGGRPVVILRPLNPAYPDLVFEPDQVRIVGKVVERKTYF